MKLIKVGRSSSCDIVLPSQNVSSLHAEITVLDNGEVFITDKNSVNGTYVAGKKIDPNVDVQIRRGDLVQLADSELPWNRVPKAENLDAYKMIINIGSNFRNDIQLTSEYSSRFHAVVKVDRKNNVTIKDLGSKNGVKVNGLKITPNKDFKIKWGDDVVCSDESITEQLKPFLPHNQWPKYLGIAAACIAALAVVGLLGYYILGGGLFGGCGVHSPACKELKSQSVMTSGVVLVQTRYYFVVEVENNPVPGWSGEKALDSDDLIQWATGTGFFIDKKGNIGTNRHVAKPWEYAQPDLRQAIQNAYEQWLDRATGYYTKITSEEQLDYFLNTELGAKIAAATNNISQLNAMLAQLRRANYKVTGRPVSYYIAYPGRYYTEISEMDKSDFIADSGTEDKDVAILQLNTKKTPAEAKFFDITRIRTDKLIPLRDQFYTIGYPHGFTLGLDEKTHDLQPGVRTCQCSKEPSRYEFEAEGAAIGGQSGSPVFDKYGHLVGLVSKSYTENNTIWAVKAEYLKEVYDRDANK